MSRDNRESDALRREVLALRSRVAELQRASARYEDTTEISLAEREELRGTMLDVTDQLRLREELAQSQKMEAVGRLAGGIAHDFNNLLTVISANLELLEERIGTSPELTDSHRALTSAASLTRRMLAFGRQAQLSLRLVAPN